MFVRFRVVDDEPEYQYILSEEDYEEEEEEPQAFLKEGAVGSYIEVEDRHSVKPWDPAENFFSWL
jgi:hypothetical protein